VLSYANKPCQGCLDIHRKQCSIVLRDIKRLSFLTLASTDSRIGCGKEMLMTTFVKKNIQMQVL